MGYQNFYATKLGTGVGSSDTTIAVQTPPSVTSGRLVLEPRNATQREIIEYAGVSGTSLTGVTRGVGGTTAKAHISGVLVEMNVTAEDLQDLYDAFDNFVASNGNGWISMVSTPTLSATNGNNSFDISFTGDKTSLLSRGMRLLIPRSTTAPTQCIDLEQSSSQYGAKSSPAGISFTDDFTIEGWVKPESYLASGESNILSRVSSTSGFYLSINTDGRLQIVVKNATSTFEFGRSKMAIPLDKWSHVAATMDLSSNTVTLYMNGVPLSVEYSATTSVTAITQSGDLQIGGGNGASNLFDGKIADVRLWSAIRTQTQIRDNMNKQLVGNETNLVGYWKLNGNWNDSTSNANNMTASGSPSFVTDNPFNANCYAIITSTPVFSGGNTTMTVQCPEGYVIPNEALTNASYSTDRSPYKFPSDRTLWSIVLPVYHDITTGSSASEAIVDSGIRLQLPTGNWDISWKFILRAAPASSSTLVSFGGLSTTTSTITNPELWSRSRFGPGTEIRTNHFITYNQTVSSATTFNFLYGGAGATVNIGIIGTDPSNGYIKIDCGYL